MKLSYQKQQGLSRFWGTILCKRRSILAGFPVLPVLNLMKETVRPAIARRLRAGSGSRQLYYALGGIVGRIFVSAYERGERVYQAMLWRGWPRRDSFENDPLAKGRDCPDHYLIFCYCITHICWFAIVKKKWGFLVRSFLPQGHGLA